MIGIMKPRMLDNDRLHLKKSSLITHLPKGNLKGAWNHHAMNQDDLENTMRKARVYSQIQKLEDTMKKP